MKKMILISLEILSLKHFLQMQETAISVLVTTQGPNMTVESIKKKYPQLVDTEIYFTQDLLSCAINENFDFSILEKYRHAQLNARTQFDRLHITDFDVDRAYYGALFFWLELFERIQPDVLYVNFLEHGSVVESVPLEIAKSQGIPCYVKCVVVSDDWFKIYDYLHEEVIDFAENSLPPQEIKNLLLTLPQRKYNVFTHKIHPFFKKLYNITCLFLKGESTRTSDWRGVRYSLFSCIKNFLYSFYLQKKYHTLAVQKVNHEKFIYVPLHLEPEATTGVHVSMKCQSIIIEMLSKALPKGWHIYVKEHPTTFRLNALTSLYMYDTLEKYRNTNFYKKIQAIPNVSIIHENIPTHTLLKKASAVATINGTAIMEAQLLKKPTLQFEGKTSLFKKTPGVYTCTSYKELTQAITMISNNTVENFLDLPFSTFLFHTRKFTQVLQNIEKNIPCKHVCKT